MTISDNIKNLQAELKNAAVQGGHNPPRLVAVSKGQPPSKIIEVLEGGHRLFGENRVQEAQQKWPELKNQFTGTELHLIGPLQTNKVKAAVQLFDVIETLDRPKLARALAKEFQNGGRTPKLFIQVNTGEEPQKAGVLPEGVEAFFKDCKSLGLKISGLMCIPPIQEESAMHFALLKKIGGKIGVSEFSMGMSGDYEIAAALGATEVRVGTSIFGPRSKFTVD